MLSSDACEIAPRRLTWRGDKIPFGSLASGHAGPLLQPMAALAGSFLPSQQIRGRGCQASRNGDQSATRRGRASTTSLYTGKGRLYPDASQALQARKLLSAEGCGAPSRSPRMMNDFWEGNVKVRKCVAQDRAPALLRPPGGESKARASAATPRQTADRKLVRLTPGALYRRAAEGPKELSSDKTAPIPSA